MFVVWVGLGFAGGGKPRPYHPNTQPIGITRCSRRGGVYPLPWGLPPPVGFGDAVTLPLRLGWVWGFGICLWFGLGWGLRAGVNPAPTTPIPNLLESQGVRVGEGFIPSRRGLPPPVGFGDAVTLPLRLGWVWGFGICLWFGLGWGLRAGVNPAPTTPIPNLLESQGVRVGEGFIPSRRVHPLP
jgi:hypothetical protein